MKEHFLPEWLSSQWATGSPDGKLQLYRVDLGKVWTKRIYPGATGYKNDLLGIGEPGLGTINKNDLELRGQVIDSKAAEIRVKLESGESLSRDERITWVRVLMYLRLREPEIVEYLRDYAPRVFEERLTSNVVEDGDPRSMLQWTKEEVPGYVENCWHQIYPDLVNSDRPAQDLLQFHDWVQDFTASGIKLLLSDRPLLLTPHLGHSDAILCLPLSPRTAFLAARSETMASRLLAEKPKDLAGRINEQSIRRSKRYVYGSDQSSERFIENRLSLKQETP